MFTKSWRTLTSRSLWLIFLLGFASGLPLALTVSTLQAWFTVEHISVTTIGWITLLGQPYTYKFLWAPLLDRYYVSAIGRRRSWLFITQSALLVLIASLAFLSPQQHLMYICIIALSISFFSATQDIAFDAYRTEILLKEEQGLGSAVMTTGYRIAMLVSGGAALIAADKIGWQKTYLIIAGLMLVGIAATCLSPEAKNPKAAAITKFSLWQSFQKPFQELWRRPHAAAILSFIVLYKFGEAFAVSLSSNFLINGVGFSLTDVGGIYKTVGLFAVLAGSYAGGILLNRLNLYRGLLFFGILQSVAILLFAWLAAAGKHYPLMLSAVFAENFGSGMAATAFLVFLMRLCNHEYTATQYALFAAIAAIGRVFVGPGAGYFVAHYSWVSFFCFGFVLTIPGLLILYYLKSKLALFS